MTDLAQSLRRFANDLARPYSEWKASDATGGQVEAGSRQPGRAKTWASLIQRFATVEEVANLVVYTCSPQASATTGAALRVDGGVVRSIA